MSTKLRFAKFSSIEECRQSVSDAIKDIQGVKFDHVSSRIVRDTGPTSTEGEVMTTLQEQIDKVNKADLPDDVKKAMIGALDRKPLILAARIAGLDDIRRELAAPKWHDGKSKEYRDAVGDIRIRLLAMIDESV